MERLEIGRKGRLIKELNYLFGPHLCRMTVRQVGLGCVKSQQSPTIYLSLLDNLGKERK